MKIDFSKFAESEVVVVPVRNNTCRYNRKVYTVSAADGWWKVSLCGNDATPVEVVSAEFSSIPQLKRYKGYTYNNQFLFKSFDVARRYFNNQIMMPYHFGDNIATFSSINVVAGEDNSLYFHSMDYGDLFIYDVVDRFNTKQTLENVKGVTPELRTVYTFHSIEREANEKALEEAKRKKALENFAATLEGRLTLAFKLTGAELLRYKVNRNGIS